MLLIVKMGIHMIPGYEISSPVAHMLLIGRWDFTTCIEHTYAIYPDISVLHKLDACCLSGNGILLLLDMYESNKLAAMDNSHLLTA